METVKLSLQDTLKQVLTQYVEAFYWQAEGALVFDEAQQIYLTLIIPQPNCPLSSQAQLAVMARIVGDQIAIHADYTNRPLVEALMAAGVAREQIVCVYLGECLPTEKDAS